MKKEWFVIASVMLTDCTAAPPRVNLPVVPSDVKVVPPANALERTKAAIAGVWDGNWEAFLDTRIIVSPISSKGADVYYIWGERPGSVYGAGIRPGYNQWGPTSGATRCGSAADPRGGTAGMFYRVRE